LMLTLFAWICSAVPLGSSPARLKTILYCPNSWDSPVLEGQVPVFKSSSNRVAQIYLQALGSLSVASYYSQGYCEGILSRLHTGIGKKSKSKSCYDRRSVSQNVLVLSSLWDLWPDIIFCLKFAVLSLWDALCDERSGSVSCQSLLAVFSKWSKI
jgi:hypothetical protein